MKTFIIGDTNFSHYNIIKYHKRPFRTIEEMNRKLIENWNETVGEDDIIYVLGNFGIGTMDELKEIFNQLNGQKYLILGEYDNRGISFYLRLGFKEVVKELQIDKYHLTSKPVNKENNIYGESIITDIGQSASVEINNYRPIEIFNKKA